MGGDKGTTGGSHPGGGEAVMNHAPNTFGAPCCNRHTTNGDPEASEPRRRGDCLIREVTEQDGTFVMTPRIYCRECCPVCGRKAA